MFGGAVVVLIGSFIVFQYYNFPPLSYLGPLLPVGILLLVGYRSIASDQSQKTSDDAVTAKVHRKAGANSFVLLLSVLTVDMTLDVFPEEGTGAISVAIGVLLYCLFFIYFRYW